ncbi:hypothetical protein [Streptomyces sp. NPDC046939]|uniref:hypothetical protein n=1 Tax=Streptomyces sp. NPDC046939 TaxID=3155376 RepID=UPI003408D566
MPEAFDDLALVRRANPVPADDPRYADGPLHHRAERSLNRLLHSSRTRRARRALVLRAEIAVCAVAALLVLALSYAAAPPASATDDVRSGCAERIGQEVHPNGVQAEKRYLRRWAVLPLTVSTAVDDAEAPARPGVIDTPR